MRIFLIPVIILVCLLLFGGCTMPVSVQPVQTSSQPVVQPAAQGATGPTVKVSIIASSFDPAIVNIQPGTTVLWVNDDRISHRVEHLPQLPSENLLFRSNLLSPGESYSYTFTQSGRYHYGDPQHAGGRDFLVIVA